MIWITSPSLGYVRLEVSFLNETPSDELISAKDALLIVGKAKDELSNIIFKRTFSEINKKIRIGHTLFNIDLSDLDLDGLEDDDFLSVLKLTFDQLEKLGYQTPESVIDPTGFLVEIPKK